MVNVDGIREYLDTLFKSAAPGVSYAEYELMNMLKGEGFFGEGAADANLGLFQKHFLTMHVLYQLKQRYFDSAEALLSISPTQIQLEPYSSSLGSALSAESGEQALSEYYLDLGNLQSATEESVSELLASFWTEFKRYTEISDLEFQQALARFNLEQPVDEKELSLSYRRQLQKYHPDKGGDSEAFMAVQRDYSVIKMKLKHADS